MKFVVINVHNIETAFLRLGLLLRVEMLEVILCLERVQAFFGESVSRAEPPAALWPPNPCRGRRLSAAAFS